jgi:hypothetical protein
MQPCYNSVQSIWPTTPESSPHDLLWVLKPLGACVALGQLGHGVARRRAIPGFAEPEALDYNLM